VLPLPASKDRRSRGPAQPPAPVGELVARAADDSDRRRALTALARGLGSSARGAGVRAVVAGRWMADVLAEAAPRIRVRDRLTLQLHHPGRTDDEIAEALIRHAGMATAALGGAAGALAAAEFVAPPTLLVAPAQLAAETLAIAAVEVKLVAELHELYGQPAAGPLSQRGTAYLMSWVRQRAVEHAVGGSGLAGVLGRAAKRELRARLLRRVGRNVTSLAPFLAGAIAGAEVNRRATRSLGDKLAAELRGRRSGLH
jgi:uncharacterized protein (DUF697 family)